MLPATASGEGLSASLPIATGTVTDAATTLPIAGAYLSAYRWNGSSYEVAGSAYTASDGAYVIYDTYGYGAGIYRFFAEVPYYRGQVTRLTWGGGTPLIVDFALVPIVADAYEPDDASALAAPIIADGGVQEHTFHVTGDHDWVTFDAVSGVTYTIETGPVDGRSTDTYLHLYRSDGTTEIAHNDDYGEGLFSRIEWTADADQTVYVMARGYFEHTSGGYGLSVAPPNEPPVLAEIGNRATDERTLLSFTATATDADGDPLTFTLGAGAPTGAATTAGGVFTWTPSEAHGPGSYPVTIVVSDGTATDSETIIITVAEVAGPTALDLEHDAAGVVFDRFVTGYSEAYSGGGYVYGRWAGTVLRASFTGSRITWIGPKQPGYGMADVWIDGALAAASIDCYAPSPGTLSTAVWESGALADGPHVIELRLTGQKNAASGGFVVVLDKFEVAGVAPSGLGTRIDDSLATPGYTGSWLHYTSPSYFNKTYAYSRWAGAAFTATFAGTRVAWVGPRAPHYGIADIYIDDVKVATVDSYRANPAAQGWREVVWQSGVLPAGEHTISIRPTGTKNAAATAANVVTDAIDVTP